MPRDKSAEIAHGLVRASGQILFRLATINSEGVVLGTTGKEVEETTTTIKEIQERLRKAACARWVELVEDVSMT